MNTEEILIKVREREETREFKDRCFRVGLCPDCGENIIEISAEPHPFLSQYKCKGCETIHTTYS